MAQTRTSFIKGGKPGPGRPKGSQNKATKTLKEMILQALDEEGGVEYLSKQARANPAAFMSLIGRVLPMTVAGDPDNPARLVMTWEK